VLANGDDGLGSEVLDQLDLLSGERPNLLAVNGDGADELVVLKHWNGEIGPGAGEFDQGGDGIIALEIGLLSPEIGNVDRLLGSSEAG
jgi:hypothetical protein